jgi:alanyl-tRNA synthetase
MSNTDRLYYTDSYRRSFDASVTDCRAAGDRFEVTLDATAFYPTSGGQPFDVGTLGRRRVLDVVDHDDGRLVHVVDGALDVGARVAGEIDWTRRFDHMQQHTGQHVLSAAFDRVCTARTESFHLGATAATIDLHKYVSPGEITAAETEANRVVWEDREVRVRFVTADEAAALPLRKEPARTGTLRLVEVPDFDLSACGGTHVARTGAIGVVAVTGWEKFKGGTRVEFQCGGRALARMREWRDALSATNRVLSVSPAELAPAIERLQNENKSIARTARGFQEQLATHAAAELVANGERIGGRIVIAKAMDGWDAAGLKATAVAAAQHPGVAIAVFSTTSPALVVVARAVDVPLDASAVLKALVARFGGKGGGKLDLAQGGGLVADSSMLVATGRELLGCADARA